MAPRRPARPPVTPWESFPACLAADTTHAPHDSTLFAFHRLQFDGPAFTVFSVRATPRRTTPFDLVDGDLRLRIDGRTYAQLPLAALDLWFTFAATLRVERGAVLDVATDRPAHVFVRGLAYRIAGEGADQ